MYKKCLCYQPFPETENSQFWAEPLGIFSKAYSGILKLALKLGKFDTNPKEGFNFIYNLHQ